MADRRDDKSIAKLLAGVDWDALEEQDEVSLLEPMTRYFSNFPWEGRQVPQRLEALEDGEEEQPEP